MNLKNKKMNSVNGCLTLNDFNGKIPVLYVYPKDNTKGCSLEAIEFNDLLDEFKKLDCVVLGLSKDSLKSHTNFLQKYDLKFNLIADENKEILKELDVIKPKKMFGREYLGVVRSTFIFDKKGKLVKEFRNVRAKGHAMEVLNYIKENLC